jgi:hypothetical protein
MESAASTLEDRIKQFKTYREYYEDSYKVNKL